MRAQIRRFLRNKGAVVGLGIILIFTLSAILAGTLAPHGPLVMNRGDELLPPGGKYLFGTDEFGRDIFSRVMHGTRISLRVGLLSVGLAATTGTFLGLVAAYFGRRVDSVIMRVMDVVMAFPSVILAIAIMAVLGSNLNNAIIAVGIVYIPRFARVARGAVLTVKNEDYVLAARALGNKDMRIIWRHILPNIMSMMIVQTTLSLAGAILAESSLSFLGLGAQPPEPSWGSILTSGREYMNKAWWYATFPGLAILFTVLGFNLLGDGLRDVIDPRLRQ